MYDFADDLRAILRCEPEIGRLYWLARPVHMFSAGGQGASHAAAVWNTRYAGREALTSVDRDGYRYGSVFSKRQFAHRVIWAICNREWPNSLIDHVNGDPSDNRIANLRLATFAQNNANKISKRGSTSRYLGVSWNKSRSKWVAQIRNHGNPTGLGYFLSEEEAARAYDAAAKYAHGQFANLNFPEAA